MGSSGSRNKSPKTPIPPYSKGAGSPGINPTVVPGGASAMNQQQQLIQANQTIAQLSNQLQTLQRGGMAPMPYGGYPTPPMGVPSMPYGNYLPPGSGTPPIPYGGYFPQGGMPPPMPYGGVPMPGQTPGYGPPSPLFQRAGGLYPNQQGMGRYRDTDFAAVASISGLEPAEVAFLYREYMNLTRNGTSKMDRTVFRQLLRDVLLEASNEHVDRAIEKMFIQIDKNHDGSIDFPEFVGAFKDVLKKGEIDPPARIIDDAIPDVLTEQLRAAGIGSKASSQQLVYLQQPQAAGPLVTTGGLSIVPLASTGIQQIPLAYGGMSPVHISDANPPLITLDPNQSSYVIATPGQYLITQPTALQCVPLPIM